MMSLADDTGDVLRQIQNKGKILLIYDVKSENSLTMLSSSPSPKRRARSQIACVVDSIVIGSPYENL
jgi:hypothetical protein